MTEALFNARLCGVRCFDKQHVRDYHLEGVGWDKKPPAPALTPDVAAKTAEKYREAPAR